MKKEIIYTLAMTCASLTLLVGCSGSGYSIYRSTNGGLTWTEHPLPTEESGTADTWNF